MLSGGPCLFKREERSLFRLLTLVESSALIGCSTSDYKIAHVVRVGQGFFSMPCTTRKCSITVRTLYKLSLFVALLEIPSRIPVHGVQALQVGNPGLGNLRHHMSKGSSFLFRADVILKLDLSANCISLYIYIYLNFFHCSKSHI